MLRFNNKMNNLGSKIKSIVIRKLTIIAAPLTANLIIETAITMINDDAPKISQADNLNWIVIVYDEEEPKR